MRYSPSNFSLQEGRARVRSSPPRSHRRTAGGGGAAGGGWGGRGCSRPGRSYSSPLCCAGGTPQRGGDSPVCWRQSAGPGRGRAVRAALRRQRGSPGRGRHHPQTRALARQRAVLVRLDSSPLRGSDGSHPGGGPPPQLGGQCEVGEDSLRWLILSITFVSA